MGIAVACAVPTGYIYNSEKLGYYWTHSLTKNPKHTSALVANYPTTGHQTTDTLD